METLRETVIKLASADLNEPLSSSKIALIDQCLHDSFPLGLHVPSHPPYFSMVVSAITELNQADGSSEYSICEYTKAKHDDLPWAHESFLSHHLSRLCDEGLILRVARDRYTIPGFTRKPVFTRVKVKGKQIVKRRVICPENSVKDGLQPQWGLSVKEEPDLVFRENKEFLSVNSGHGIDDGHVTNERIRLVVVKDKEGNKGQEEDQESELFWKGEELEMRNGLIDKLSITEKVKFCRRKNKFKLDQLLAEEESSVDYSSGDEWMEDGDEWMENDTSIDNPTKKKRKNVENPVVDRVIVYALGAKLANPAESGRHVTRQDVVNPVVDRVVVDNLVKIKKEDVEIPVVDRVVVENLVKEKKKGEGNPVIDRVVVFAIGAKLPYPTRKSKKFTMFPVSKFPSLELQKHDNLQKASILSSQKIKGNWPSWVPSLLKTDFYVKCQIHANVEKSICNMYCSDCKDGALCASCVTSHEGHHVIKIKQADFEQLVDVSEIDNVDIEDIRTIRESSTVTAIVLKSVATWKAAAKNNSACVFCKNRVPFPNKFCSLNCKFEHEQKVG